MNMNLECPGLHAKSDRNVTVIGQVEQRTIHLARPLRLTPSKSTSGGGSSSWVGKKVAREGSTTQWKGFPTTNSLLKGVSSWYHRSELTLIPTKLATGATGAKGGKKDGDKAWILSLAPFLDTPRVRLSP